jgi:hypothetical protein
LNTNAGFAANPYFLRRVTNKGKNQYSVRVSNCNGVLAINIRY